MSSEERASQIQAYIANRKPRLWLLTPTGRRGTKIVHRRMQALAQMSEAKGTFSQARSGNESRTTISNGNVHKGEQDEASTDE